MVRMRSRDKPFILPQNTESTEGWRDKRTNIRLAPGAVQNWPTKDDEQYLVHIYENPKPHQLLLVGGVLLVDPHKKE